MKQVPAGTVRIAALITLAALLSAAAARAQMRPMGIPLTTTMVISKPAPDQLYGNKQIVTFGIDQAEYKYVLEDAYVDDASGRVRWPDIWQQVRIYRPNFVVQGPNAQAIASLKPGDMVTIKGMYAPMDRTFEVMFLQQGKGAFEPKKQY